MATPTVIRHELGDHLDRSIPSISLYLLQTPSYGVVPVMVYSNSCRKDSFNVGERVYVSGFPTKCLSSDVPFSCKLDLEQITKD